MTAICNATGLVPQSNGLSFPPATRFEHADVCKPRSDGGVLEKAGVTEVTSSMYRDGTDVPRSLVMGTYVVITSRSDYAKKCFAEYQMLPDKSGQYAALYRPTHMIGLELGLSVASAALRREATGSAICFNSDVCATTKRALKQGEVLDGEGGFCVWGQQTPAEVSVREGYLPLGLAQGVALLRDVPAGARLRWSDVRLEADDPAVRFRREMERAFPTPIAG
jgi:predicted homoserine dehydrogenase-like protein